MDEKNGTALFPSVMSENGRRVAVSGFCPNAKNGCSKDRRIESYNQPDQNLAGGA
jgi:hypothetical protein